MDYNTASSFITLSAAIIPAVILIATNRDRSVHSLTLSVLQGIFFMFGGLLISGMLLSLSGNSVSPLISATLVLGGALLLLVPLLLWRKRKTKQTETAS